MKDHRVHRSHARWQRLAGLALVLMLVPLLYGLHAAHTSRADGSADISITLTPDPNVSVTPGSILAYQLRVRNFSSSDAARVLVHMPYDPHQLTVLDAQFTGTEDWVTGVQGDYLTMSFEDVDGNSTRTATIRMLVAEQLPAGSVIYMWAGYGWDDDNGGGEGYSANAAPVVVAEQPVNSGAAWLSVDPQVGPPGTIYSFFSDRFAPGERFSTTLNTPQGTQPLDLQGHADDLGRAWIVFDSTGLVPGSYELVVRSERTEQIAVASFFVE